MHGVVAGAISRVSSWEPARQMRPAERQKVETEGPPPQSPRHTTYTTDTAVELRDLAKQWERRRGCVPARPLCLRGDGADNTESSPVEMGQLAGRTTVPSLRQRLQNARQTSPGAGIRLGLAGRGPPPPRSGTTPVTHRSMWVNGLRTSIWDKSLARWACGR